MSRLDGVSATRQLRAVRPTPVLALTTFDDDEALAGMLRAGASGFVLKGVPAEELHRAVQVVAEGGAWLDPAVTGRVLAVYREGARQSDPPTWLSSLAAGPVGNSRRHHRWGEHPISPGHRTFVTRPA